MRRQVKNRGMMTFYVRPTLLPILNKFIENINKDREMKRLQTTNRPNQLVSVAIIQLMHEYNQKKREEESEASNQTSN